MSLSLFDGSEKSRFLILMHSHLASLCNLFPFTTEQCNWPVVNVSRHDDAFHLGYRQMLTWTNVRYTNWPPFGSVLLSPPSRLSILLCHLHKDWYNGSQLPGGPPFGTAEVWFGITYTMTNWLTTNPFLQKTLQHSFRNSFPWWVHLSNFHTQTKLPLSFSHIFSLHAEEYQTLPGLSVSWPCWTMIHEGGKGLLFMQNSGIARDRSGSQSQVITAWLCAWYAN